MCGQLYVSVSMLESHSVLLEGGASRAMENIPINEYTSKIK